jgi:hypothetical protein
MLDAAGLSLFAVATRPAMNPSIAGMVAGSTNRARVVGSVGR